MIDVHQNATLSESFEGDRSRVIGNRCNKNPKADFIYEGNIFKLCLTKQLRNVFKPWRECGICISVKCKYWSQLLR